jgi:sortase A
MNRQAVAQPLEVQPGHLVWDKSRGEIDVVEAYANWKKLHDQQVIVETEAITDVELEPLPTPVASHSETLISIPQSYKPQLRSGLVPQVQHRRYEFLQSETAFADSIYSPEPTPLLLSTSSLSLPRLSPKSVSWAVGQALVVASVFLIILFSSPLLAMEMQSIANKLDLRLDQQFSFLFSGNSGTPTTTTQSTEGVSLTREEEVIPPEEERFRVVIPKISVDANVIPNVDSSRPELYEQALKEGIAHAKGTALPGEENSYNRTVFIFGHSTSSSLALSRYNTIFYNLKDLDEGDTIDVWFWGNKFTYKVTEKLVLEPDDVGWLDPQTEKDQLILQTCWPPGSVAKRLIVIAEPVRD